MIRMTSSQAFGDDAKVKVVMNAVAARAIALPAVATFAQIGVIAATCAAQATVIQIRYAAVEHRNRDNFIVVAVLTL
jgi:hypothetical protein